MFLIFLYNILSLSVIALQDSEHYDFVVRKRDFFGYFPIKKAVVDGSRDHHDVNNLPYVPFSAESELRVLYTWISPNTLPRLCHGSRIRAALTLVWSITAWTLRLADLQ